jgi:hypothetical protein
MAQLANPRVPTLLFPETRADNLQNFKPAADFFSDITTVTQVNATSASSYLYGSLTPLLHYCDTIALF